MVHRIASRYDGKVKVGKFDIGDQGKLGRKLGIEQGVHVGSIPHVMIFKGGEARVNFKRPPSEGEIADALDGLLR